MLLKFVCIHTIICVAVALDALEDSEEEILISPCHLQSASKAFIMCVGISVDALGAAVDQLYDVSVACLVTICFQ